MTYTKYKDIPNRREPLGGRDHIQHIETSLSRVVPGPGEVVVGTPDGPVAVDASTVGGEVDPHRTISLIGDVHVGYTNRPGNDERLAEAAADLATLKALHVHRLYVGDLVDAPGAGYSGTTPGANDTAFLQWASALDPDRATWDAAVGNHDLLANRTGDQWAAIYGYDDQNWVRDLGFCRVISIGADNITDHPSAHQTMSAATVTWLDTELGKDGRDTIILSHGPLANTSIGIANQGFTTFLPQYHTHPDADLLAVLDRHAHARAWVCGHTHTAYEVPGAITHHWTGSRNIAHINAGSLAYINNTVPSADDPLRSLFLTVKPDAIEVRIRNHRTAAWERLHYNAVTVLAERQEVPSANPTAFVLPLNGTLSGENMTLATVGDPAFEEVGGEQALMLTSTTHRASINPFGVLSAAQGSLVVRASYGDFDGAARQYLLYQGSFDGGNRLYLQRPNSPASPGVHAKSSITLGAAAIATGRDPVPDNTPKTYALDWKAGVATLREDGVVVGRGTYTAFEAFSSQLFVGARGSSGDHINGPLFGLAGFRRPLTSEEHKRLATTPTDEWTMQTVTQ